MTGTTVFPLCLPNHILSKSDGYGLTCVGLLFFCISVNKIWHTLYYWPICWCSRHTLKNEPSSSNAQVCKYHTASVQSLAVAPYFKHMLNSFKAIVPSRRLMLTGMQFCIGMEGRGWEGHIIQNPAGGLTLRKMLGDEKYRSTSNNVKSGYSPNKKAPKPVPYQGWHKKANAIDHLDAQCTQTF
jgi:hypothetical protein